MGRIQEEPSLRGSSVSHNTDSPKPLTFADSKYNAPYYWGKSSFDRKGGGHFPTQAGYSEARDLIGNGDQATLEDLTTKAFEYIQGVFAAVKQSGETSAPFERLARLCLSDELISWRDGQFKQGKILPQKGTGLKRVSDKVLQLFGAERWPECVVTCGAFFGCGIFNLLIGGYDQEILFSNYIVDMAFYYEHGYHKVFPEFEKILKDSMKDAHAFVTLGGVERRAAGETGIRYIKGKVDLEVGNKANLSFVSAKMDRRTAQIMSLSESSLLGLAAEAVARGFDPAGVMSDLVFSSPGTDVVDVCSDLQNSEVMNSFLNTADITDTGVVTEDALRKVYDAYAQTGARMFVHRWAEPTARISSALYYTWHITNDRHRFLRRALLGYPLARKTAPGTTPQQREGDWDEVFDEHFHTTGFSRPLDGACDGGDPCNAVKDLLDGHEHSSLLAKTWWHMITRVMEYISGGVVDEGREEELTEDLSLVEAECYSKGLVLELAWLLAHASQHAWQVNYIFEAAMFGSLLDNGKLVGKLDRED